VEVAQRTGATVIAHRADAAVIRGLQPPAPPQLTELERPLAEMLFGDPAQLPGRSRRRCTSIAKWTTATSQLAVAPSSVCRDTPGSIALLVPHLGVLFTGDTIASYEGAPILGPYNIDRLGAIESIRKQARLEFDIACVGHGKPIVGGASRKVPALIRSF
jgi:hypothetical protein